MRGMQLRALLSRFASHGNQGFIYHFIVKAAIAQRNIQRLLSRVLALDRCGAQALNRGIRINQLGVGRLRQTIQCGGQGLRREVEGIGRISSLTYLFHKRWKG